MRDEFGVKCKHVVVWEPGTQSSPLSASACRKCQSLTQYIRQKYNIVFGIFWCISTLWQWAIGSHCQDKPWPIISSNIIRLSHVVTSCGWAFVLSETGNILIASALSTLDALFYNEGIDQREREIFLYKTNDLLARLQLLPALLLILSGVICRAYISML